MQLPFIKVNHRNGAVFVRVVHKLAGHRAAVVVRMTPHEAMMLGDDISYAGWKAENPGIRPVLKPAKRKAKV